MKTEVDETLDALMCLLSEWKQYLVRAEKVAQQLEQLLELLRAGDGTGAAFGYCAYCYAESCEGCRYRLRRPAEEKGGERHG